MSCRESPGTKYRYCEATEGCKKAVELTDYWRINSRKVLTGKYESSNFGNDRWVYFSEGLKHLPEAPPPKNVGGLNNAGFITKSIFVNKIQIMLPYVITLFRLYLQWIH